MIKLRPVQQKDHTFLFKLFRKTYDHDIDFGDDENAIHEYYEEQFLNRENYYTKYYPSIQYYIVLLSGKEVGRLSLDYSDKVYELIDLALLPAYRGMGVGGYLIESLKREAAENDSEVAVRVDKGNAASRLFERKGFVELIDGGFIHEFKWRPQGYNKDDYYIEVDSEWSDLSINSFLDSAFLEEHL